MEVEGSLKSKWGKRNILNTPTSTRNRRQSPSSTEKGSQALVSKRRWKKWERKRFKMKANLLLMEQASREQGKRGGSFRM